ncbi:heavy-metal-associated domain-containing protein [Polaromonas sp.]|jgi:copper chaperone CopZ|uniref:heavy-metal-associated domain-containing protein n=1 Tax=Polaromonas sp. TaxID=1869339 RepID=UPI002CF85100|nr:heavy-metal-associated domain-containing protein [Polaromonas sp.]HQS30358.1 heavy-metal-associated domain-containing protein [Polaromonas sp.]HQS90382.1 heavy-metal-associated domain-containing protein [Polaromonas sp.]
MQTLHFDISGMTCGGCAGSVKRALGKLHGVSHAETTLHPGSAAVTVDPDQITPAQIEVAITGLGYPARQRSPGTAGKEQP